MTVNSNSNLSERTEGPVVLPKDSRKKWIYVANAMVFLVAIIYFAVLSILLPKPTTSEVERRDLAKAPHFTTESYFSKEYTQKLDTFYADTFPGREGFIKISYAINEAKGIAGEVKLYKAEMHEVQNDLPAPTPTPTPTPE
ncbi:MAG: DHHW family protein, partial [Angelakisella sp.]